jgi:thioredoxin reductase (NADPH)
VSEPDTCSYDRRVNPSIVIVAPGHADTLTGEFGRYARDYDVRTTPSVTQAEDVARSIVDAGGQVALFVSESRLPGGDVVDAFTRWPPPSPRPRSRRCGSSPRATMR